MPVHKNFKLSIGTDIADISSFEKFCHDRDVSFLTKNFTDKEIDYCFSKESPAPHLAARFAGKEAVIKALYSHGLKALPFREIEIVNDDKGLPMVKINVIGYEKIKIGISLSHCEDKAIAFAIIYRDDIDDE